MCGITGLAGFRDDGVLQQMTRSLIHRGPDDEGYFHSETVSFGHRRLAILDPEHGQQPVCDQQRSVWVTFNGQIYNHQQIRQDYPDYPFQSHCDTEVLPLLHCRLGMPGMLSRLRGMFAFALWDSNRQELWLVRDRLGIKPLYYYLDGSRLLFGSEIKALLCYPGLRKQLNPLALVNYLSLFYVPSPQTIFEGVQQLPAAHWLRWKDGCISTGRYWDSLPRPCTNQSPRQWVPRIQGALEDAVLSHTISDVPLGTFLSGGLDSSTVTGVLAENHFDPLETFCIGYGPEGHSYEERPHARRLAEHFQTTHHELQISVNLEQGLLETVQAFDEPFGNPMTMLSGALARFSRQSITVALSGDGGDELFGGYPRYQGLLASQFLALLPGAIRELLLRGIARREPLRARNYRRWLRELLEGMRFPAAQRYSRWVGNFSGLEIGSLLRQPYLDGEHTDMVVDWFNRPDQGDMVNRAMYADRQGFLPENVLRCTDRMSMLHSLEVRVPFADHQLVEMMAEIPGRYHVSLFDSKRLMKKSVGPWVPEFVTRRKKLGFVPPLAIWLKEAPGRELMRRWLDARRVEQYGLLNTAAVERLLTQHDHGYRDHGVKLWALMVLQAWCEKHL